MNPDICIATADCYDLNDHNTEKRFIDGNISRELLTHALAPAIHRERYLRLWQHIIQQLIKYL